MEKLLILGVTVAVLTFGTAAYSGNATKSTVNKPSKKVVKVTPKRSEPTTRRSTAAAAKKTQSPAGSQAEQWDVFQIGVWFDTPTATKYSKVYGIKIGAPFCSGEGLVKGIETAVFCGATKHITGLQACILTCMTDQMTGLQFSIVNIAKNVKGVQLGIVNVAEKKSFQIGIINYIKDAPIPWLPIVNFKF